MFKEKLSKMVHRRSQVAQTVDPLQDQPQTETQDQDIRTQASPVAWCTYCRKAFWEGGEEEPARFSLRILPTSKSERATDRGAKLVFPICVDCLVSREEIKDWAKVSVSVGVLSRLIASGEPEVTVTVGLLRQLKGELSEDAN